MPISAIDALVRIGLWFFEWLVNKQSNNDQLKAAFKEFAELARTANIQTIEQRKKAEGQLDAGNAAWDKLEEETRRANTKG